MDAIKNFIITSLQPTVVLLVGILTILFNNRFNKKDVSYDRLEKVYHPLFLEIEPLLYKENLTIDETSKFIDTFNQINKQHSLYIDYFLKLDIKKFIEITNKENEAMQYYWDSICSNIDKTYDKLCKLSGIPTRKLKYRIHNKQYKSEFRLTLDLLASTFKQTSVLLQIFILYILISMFITQIKLQVLK